MITRKFYAVLTALLILFLTACNIPTNPAPATNVPVVTNSPAPTTLPTATIQPTTAAETTATTVPPTATGIPPTPTSPAGSSAPVITGENAVNLSLTSLTLPEYPGRLVWRPDNVDLPAGFPAAANLLAQAQGNVYPIQVDPPVLDEAIALKVPGEIQAFAPDLSSVITRTESGPFALYRLDGTLVYTFDLPDPYGASYSADGKLAAITSQNEHAVTLYDIANGKAQTRLTGFESAAPVYGAGIVPGNQTIYWIARANLQFQDVASGQMGAKLSYSDFILSTAFSPDGQRLYLVVEGKLRAVKVPSGEQLLEITLSQGVNSLSVSPDGKLLAGGYGTNLQIWDANALASLTLLPGPNTFTGGVTFSPDGRYLASVHEGNIVNIWRVKGP